jgi:TDG/mug DNA glycosylase family protein
MPRLRDVVCERPALLLVGINPGLRSGALGHHFAGRGNPFWRLLHAARLTPRLLTHEEDTALADFGIALTNLCPRMTRTADELTADELARGRRTLIRKCAVLQPRVVALVGVTVYTVVFGARAGGGAGPKPERLGGAPVFVVPNPSGLNASYPGFAHKLVWYRRLQRFVAAATSADGARSSGRGRSDRASSGSGRGGRSG